MGSLSRTKLSTIRQRLLTCLVLIMLSVEWLNPVNLLTEVLEFDKAWVAPIAFIGFISILVANGKDLTYYVVKMFFHNILNIFFSSIEVLGRENIPAHGPVIFSGNHMNQFVDGAVALITCPHKMNFLVAASSFKMAVVGMFARMMNALPVERPIDNAHRGVGEICFVGMKLLGKGTRFSELDLRDRIRPLKCANTFKIIKVINDEEAELGMDKGDASPLDEDAVQGANKWRGFDVLTWVDQTVVFSEVHSAIQRGESVIIFPEGGSHDNADLLPLKGGVAAIAFGSLSENVCIVPVGLNYFRGHRFRGRVVVEYGAPIYIDRDTAQLVKTSKREAYTKLLKDVASGMRSVLVTADSYDDLKLIHTARRLYQRSSTILTTQRRQDLARRFSMGHRILKDRFDKAGSVPKDLQDLERDLVEYQGMLETWGIFDYQVNNLNTPYTKLLYTFMHGLIIILAASLPSVFLNAPVGFAAKWWAEKQQKKALAKSRVKINATDVVLSNKITFSIVAVPTLWVSYALLMYFYSSWRPKTILLLFLSTPILSYVGIKSVEATMTDLKDLRPAFLRLLPSFREQAKTIQQRRAVLQKHVRAAVRKYGPSMGPLYTEKNAGVWESEMRTVLGSSSQGGEDLLKKLETDHEEDSDVSGEDGGAGNREGVRIPTGIQRFKDD